MKVLILTGLTYYDRAYSLSGIIKAQAKMLSDYGHEVGIVVAKGMGNKEHFDGFTLYEAVDTPENTFENIKPIAANYDVIFTHDWGWVEYMEWLDKVAEKLEDEYPDKRFYHFIHSAPGSEMCPEWQKGRNKKNVWYCYPNEFDRPRTTAHLGLPSNKVLTVRLSNDVFNQMGTNEDMCNALGLFDADYVGFYPSHLMPGKQAHEILKVIKVMVERGLKVKYLFTANSMESGEARERLDSYRQLCKEYKIEDAVIWLPDFPEFFGRTDYKTIQSIWKITNLFITPSMSETTSLMLLEAMAHRCIIVANESLALNKELLGDGAIYHMFGSHLNPKSNMDDVTLNRLVDFIVQWNGINHPIYTFNRLKKMYSTRSIYDNYYKPILEDYVEPVAIEGVVVDPPASFAPGIEYVSMPKISVVIPIMNSVEELVNFTKKTIETVRYYPNVELILVNNHKADTTNYGADVSIVNEVNVGVPKAWNQGMRMATGDYIMILNSDIELPENWAEAMMKYDGMVFPWSNEEVLGEGLIDGAFAFPNVHGCCFMAKRETFQKINDFDETPYTIDKIKRQGNFDERFFAYYEDADFWKRCQLVGVLPYRAGIKIKHAVNATSGKMPNLGQIISDSEHKFQLKWGV